LVTALTSLGDTIAGTVPWISARSWTGDPSDRNLSGPRGAGLPSLYGGSGARPRYHTSPARRWAALHGRHIL